ncbi:MAG: outer membrane lipoprotein carrier protein LolA [Paludibacter sp.]|nr:outer membrane lipoprotein carrier protein LolA [Bacteroidales bacterium]MCM1069777.1 outer membrane lipoprotein carrier protein LolA [Prevotella sp.]MCM1354499.1 outer membrane lipoprotein carrier protein LolA [Bacteroides sp.]MCM1443302.1 outer membrane lipoprotein carrier protein LolA [Muribaculum sp.]MCM1482426.1 outer membrane lipoprotein carrier protein LolA [Paludibacter sp.]
MKKLLILSFACLSLIMPMQAQNVEGRLLTLNSKHATFVAPFTETKVMPRLKKETHKEGTLYFASPDALSMRYSNPEGDITLIKDGKFMVRRSGKVQKFALKTDNSPMLLLRNTLLYSFQGDIKRVAEENKANLVCKESATRFVINIERKNSQKVGVNSLQLIYDKITGALLSLRLEEANGNYTLYETPGGVQGQIIPDNVWVIE